MSEIKKTTSVGKPISRIDGFLKVTGSATYAAEWQVPELAHAVLIQSSIAAGEIESFDLREALGVSGVIDILTFENSPKASMPGAGIGTGPGESFVPLQSNEVFYNGQFIGAVVAKTFEAARHAASLVRVRYQEKLSKIYVDDRLSESFEKTRMMGVLKLNKHKGNAEKAFAAAPVKIEQKYSTAMVHHAPIEPSAIIAAWNEKQDELRVYDSTQAVADFAKMYSKAFKISLDRTQVIAKFIGGGFGGKGSVWPHQLIAILAAQKTKRPIKLSVSREQMFTAIGYRATTRQTVKLGAERDGTLLSLEHHSLNATAVNNDYVESSAVSTPTLYKVKNWKVRHDLIKVNLQAPTFMRAPGEATGSFALESAMDELAHELELDPIQLALKNYTDVDNANGRPYTSKSLRACYERGAKEFGWADRTHTPGTRREGDWLIGMGVALAHYPTRLFPAKAEVEVFEDGRVEVRSATQDIGTGTYTIMAQVAAEVLQIPLEQITIKIGDSAFPRSSVSGGSSGAASVTTAVFEACTSLKAKLIKLAQKHKRSTEEGFTNESLSSLLRDANRESLKADGSVGLTVFKQLVHSSSAFGAQFVEVGVHAETREIKLRRALGVFAAGKILNPKTARSQLIGGMIFGIGAALMEDTQVDENSGRLVTKDFAHYHIPVQRDLGESIEALMLDEVDNDINAYGAKGVGELGIVGISAAIANAVFNATGVRLRELPMKIESLSEATIAIKT